MRWMLLLLAGCELVGRVGPLNPPNGPEDCIPTTGDNCDCEPKCMTQQELDRIGARCDLGCFFGDTGASGPNWTCTVVNDECVVADDDT